MRRFLNGLFLFRLWTFLSIEAREDVERFLVLLAKGRVCSRLMRFFEPIIVFWSAKYDRLIFRKKRPVTDIRNVMVYSHNIGGHRHIYSKRFIDYYSSKGLQVYFVFRGLHTTRREFMSYSTRHTESYKGNPNVHLVDMSDPSFRLSGDFSDVLRFIIRIQRKFSIDLTVFVDGDALFKRFARQVWPWAPKLIGKNYAVFILSEFIYQEPMMPRCGQAFFHLFLFKYLSLLDGGLYSDENVVEVAKSRRHIHLPEVGNSLLPPDHDEERKVFYARAIDEYREFLQKHEGKEVILNFGDLEPRKGFDLLLRLVEENKDLVLVRCGRTKPQYSPDWPSILNKESLIRQGRIFELDTYVEDQGLFDALYQSIRCFILPYKDFYRTSSVMLQALQYTKPVLVPDVGLLRDRVERNGLGRTFENLSYESLCEEHRKLRSENHLYDENIRRYVKEYFASECYEKIFERTLVSYNDEESTSLPLIEAYESA